MQKPGFSVVSMVCVLLGIFGFCLMLLRSLLPAQPANSMRLESDEYLRQGANQQVDWKLLSDRAFAEARRLERPIMLVMGTVGSRDARLADTLLFSDQDVQSYLSRNFICVRVDLDAQPYWGNAFLPLSRANIGIQPSFQVWYLDPQGRLFDFLGNRGFPSLTDPVLFLDELTGARASYEKFSLNPSNSLQQDDWNRFESAPSEQPNLIEFSRYLQERIDPKWGGFPLGETQSPRMSAVQMLLEAGEIEAVRRAVNPMLRSGIVDWLDGGFFRRARRRDWTDIEYDKLALSTSEAMRVLATYSVLVDDPFAGRISKNAFETLVSDFSEQGLISTARIGDENAFTRSAKSSFSAKDLRAFWGTGLLTPEEAVEARKLFGLEVETNPQMSLRVADPSEFDSPQFEIILGKLRAHKDKIKTKYSVIPNAYVNGAVCAALYFCSRLWQDEERLQHAEERFGALQAFGAGADITHHTVQRAEDVPFLGDYLGMSEACLERFLATGDVASLQRGSSILERAEKLFDGLYGWTPSLKRLTALIPGSDYPQVIDGNAESLYGRSIRLNNAYGRLLRGGQRASQAGVFSENAFEMVGRGSLFVGLGTSVAGFAAASASVLDDTHAIVVGRGAVSLANKLFRLRPTRLIAPAVGLVRQDLQKRAPGIYIIVGSEVTGPFDLETAASKLDWRYHLP